MYRESQLKALFEGCRILIAGYGREGRSSERLIRQLLPEADITVVEGNDNIKAEAAKGYDLIMKSPGIPTFVFENADGGFLCNPDTITSQTDIFLQIYGGQTVGVTGTKGKSTTTNLIAAIVRRHTSDTIMAGNMGIPLFDVIPQIEADTVVVCEFSCHQLENIHRAPHIAVLLNLFQEHLDHYHSYRDYQMAKLQVGLRQREGDTFFYCADNAALAALVDEERAGMGGIVKAYSLRDPLAERLSKVERRLQGDHNLSNLVVVYMVAAALGVDEAVVLDTIATFQGLEHRLELVGTYDGITFYNDSISTIPEACMAAVGALKEVDTLILGGFDRGIDYSDLGTFLAQSAIGNLVFVGAAGVRIHNAYRQAADELGKSVEARHVLVESDYGKIVPWCKVHTAKGKVCLLSPAAASYDAFKNFEERGRVFKSLVKADN